MTKEQVIEWIQAATSDGWSLDQMYKHDSEAWRLSKDGFVCQCVYRERDKSVHAWGPDQLAVEVPVPYDFNQLNNNLKKCNICGKTGVDTHRYSFAGRCCAECLPEARKKHEYPGWCD